jgi:hypothetical protein
MPHEIIRQPSHLELPDKSDRILRTFTTPLQCEWLRFVAPQLELETNKLILGVVLYRIIGDDENSFGLYIYIPELTETAKTSIFNRMDWESELPELPLIIRNQIKKIRRKLESFNWEGEENFNKAYEMWMKDVRHYTKHQIAINKDLHDALGYYEEVKHIWLPYWNKFLFDHVLIEK